MLSTAALIDSLVDNFEPAHPRRPLATLALGIAVGAVATLVGVVAQFGVQPGLDGPQQFPLLIKAAYGLTLASLALAGVTALSRPGNGRPDGGWLAWPLLALAAFAAFVLLRAPIDAWPRLILGGSWQQCPIRIALLSVPIFAGAVLALRGQAPVQLRRAGAAAGLLAGSVAASLYALACTESSPAFVLVWYSLGIAVSAGAGWLLGPRLLRW